MSKRYFKKFAYSADGNYVLAGGNSKNICIYDLEHKVLLKKIVFTENRSLDGVLEFLNSKNIQDGLNVNDIDDDEESDPEERRLKDSKILPGAKTYDFSKRNVKLRVEVNDLKFSPDGKAWAIASPEGLLAFSNQA